VNDSRAKKIILAQLLIRDLWPIDAAQEQRLVGWLTPPFSADCSIAEQEAPSTNPPLHHRHICMPSISLLCSTNKQLSCIVSGRIINLLASPWRTDAPCFASTYLIYERFKYKGTNLKKIKNNPTEHVQASQAQQHRNYPLIIDTKSSFSDQSSEV